MNATSPTARDIFLAAIKLPPAEWDRYLDQTCEDDPDMRHRLVELLNAHREAGSILNPQAPIFAKTIDSPGDEPPIPDAAGNVIGPYKLLEEIGEGGFGVVFMAEQAQPVRRRVALKVLKPGMDTRQVVARFEAERQALAIMDHPNIAKIFDGGATPSGRPYFVMELVKGVPITDFSDQNHLTPRQRLELFIPVCQAVQHAHHKGIIHRDIKPSNVLVSLHDGIPVVKVIDFGVAKALGQQLTDKTVFTGFVQMIGTPLYMSPEQAEFSGLDVDSRTDIYSLGVLLYELLTGTTPFDKERLKEAAFDEIRRIIRENEPPKPSVRISTLGKVATTVSMQRKSDPWRLSQLFRGELDWIVMKALEKDRTRRYETVSAFAADVHRYLRDEPVEACPPSAVYRFRKFARRNKAALVSAITVTTAVVLTLVSLAGAVHLLARSNAEIKKEQEETNSALGRERQANQELLRALYFQNIALAEREQAFANWGRVEELLEASPAELRGWEWHYLKRLRHTPPLTLALAERQSGGTGFSLDFSPDGRRLAAPCGGHAIKVWDLATREEVAVFHGHTQRVVRVVFSPDGQRLASGGDDQTVKVWDLPAGGAEPSVARFTLQGHHGGVRTLSFSPDGRFLASADTSDRVILWDSEQGALLHEFPGEFTRFTYLNLAFSPDSRWLASGSSDNTVLVWDVKSGQPVFTLRGHTEPVFSVFFSRDGRRLLSLGWDDNSVRVWDLPENRSTNSPPEGESLAPRLTLKGHSRGAWSAAFSPDGQRIAVAGGVADSDVRIYDADTGRLLQTLEGHIYRAISVAFSPDGKRLASTGMDRTVKLWETSSGQEVLTLRGHVEPTSQAVFSRDGWRLASVSVEGTLKVWDATPFETSSQRHTMTLGGHAGVVYGVAFSPDGRRLASASADQSVRVWDAAAGRELLSLRGHTNKALCVAYSPDGRFLASGGLDKVVRLWDARTGRKVFTIDRFTGPVRSLSFSPDGGRLATCGGLDVVQVWDTTTAQPVIPPLCGHLDFVQGVAFSPDGQHIATAGTDRTARIWNAQTGQEASRLEGAIGRVYAVAFSPDGSRVACGDSDQNVKVWEWATREMVHDLGGHTHHVFSVAFSPDGQHLASASWAEVIVWDSKSGANVRTLDGHAGTIWGVTFSPDGQRLAVASGYKGKGEIKLWDAALWTNPSLEEH